MAKRFSYDFNFRSRQRLFTAFLAAATSLLGLGLIFALSTGFLGSSSTKTDPIFSFAQTAATPTLALITRAPTPTPKTGLLDLVTNYIDRDGSNYYIYYCLRQLSVVPPPIPATLF